jgi:hypothetical protein
MGSGFERWSTNGCGSLSRKRLTVVFWGYCVAGTLVVGVLMFWAFRLFPAPHRNLGNFVSGAIFVAYLLWAHLSLWMCAFNVKRTGWGYAARCYAVVVVVGYFAGVAANFGSGPAGIHKVVLPVAAPAR